MGFLVLFVIAGLLLPGVWMIWKGGKRSRQAIGLALILAASLFWATWLQGGTVVSTFVNQVSEPKR